MTKILTFDLCAVFVLLLLLYSVYSRKVTKAKKDKAYIVLLIVTAVSAVFDILCEMFGVWVVPIPTSTSVTVFRFIAYSLYFITRNLSALIYICFILCVTDTWHKLKKEFWFNFLLYVPYAINVILVLVNIFTPIIFSFNDQLEYVREPLFFTLYVAASIYLFFGMILLFKYRNMFSKTKMFVLYSTFIFTIFSIIVQYFFQGWMIEIFCTSLALFLVKIVFQNPGENMNHAVGARNRNAYCFDVKLGTVNNKHMDIILVDIQNFSSVLSLVGYETFNHILRQTAHKIAQVAKWKNTHIDIYYIETGRYGLVISENYREKTDEIIEAIKEEFSASILMNQMKIMLNIRLCVMRYPDEIADYETIIKFSNIFEHLDANVNYIDTKSFTNWKQFHIANDIDKIIARAIQKRSFEIYYQPIWSTKEQRFVCAEALLRLFDEKYGFIPPLTIISNAEKSEAIIEIGDIVLEKVASFIASPDFKKLNLDYIDINLSPVQCVDPNLVDKICNIVSKYNISPSTINFEITETAISILHSVIINNLEELAYKGFRVSLDDYGTGYSNIKRMVECPFNIIKLDKTFADECENERMKVVLKDTVNMLKNIEMGIVVEGVETSENAELFSSLGCDYIQGYYYSKPMPKNDFIKFVESSKAPEEE